MPGIELNVPQRILSKLRPSVSRLHLNARQAVTQQGVRCTKHLERRIFRQANPKSHVYNLYDRTDLLNNANADRLCLVKRLKSLEISKIGVCQASQSKIQVPRHQEPFGLNAWLPCSNTLSFDNCPGG